MTIVVVLLSNFALMPPVQMLQQMSRGGRLEPHLLSNQIAGTILPVDVSPLGE